MCHTCIYSGLVAFHVLKDQTLVAYYDSGSWIGDQRRFLQGEENHDALNSNNKVQFGRVALFVAKGKINVS